MSRRPHAVLFVLSVCAVIASILGFDSYAEATDFDRIARLPAVGRASSQTPHPAVVRIIAPEKGAMALGSGTLVDVRDQAGLVVTNWHVVRDATGPVTVAFPDGFRSAARVLHSDRNWDLAALLISRPHATPVPIASRAPRPGEALAIAGYGSGSYRMVSGRCTQYVAPGANFPYEMLELSVEARQGDSGGPIFNQQGELAGVLFGAARGTTSGSYAGRVQNFLASCWPDVGAGDRQMIAVDEPAEQPAADRLVSVPPPVREHTTAAPAPPIQFSPAPPSRFSAPPKSTPNDVEVVSRSFHWRDLTGDTPFQQAKTVLAAIGLLTLLVQFLRLGS